MKTGDPLDESVDVGPMISEADAVRAESWVKEAIAGGAELLPEESGRARFFCRRSSRGRRPR